MSQKAQHKNHYHPTSSNNDEATPRLRPHYGGEGNKKGGKRNRGRKLSHIDKSEITLSRNAKTDLDQKLEEFVEDEDFHYSLSSDSSFEMNPTSSHPRTLSMEEEEEKRAENGLSKHK